MVYPISLFSSELVISEKGQAASPCRAGHTEQGGVVSVKTRLLRPANPVAAHDLQEAGVIS